MATEKIYTGYFGFIQTGGQGRFINITNLASDEVTIRITGDFELSVGDENTRIEITNLDGELIYDSAIGGENISLVEFGQTGEMADLVSGYNYTVITVGGVEYIFLDDYLDPTSMVPNPFSAGRNPLDGDPTTGDDGITHSICFVNGSRILTPDGERLVEELLVGDFVNTLGNGLQEIVWTGRRLMTGAMDRKHAPIRISANAFGKGLPARDLFVSPQHRVLITDWRAELLFGVPEVLVAAKHLVNDSTIRVETRLESFSYHHILFEKHETVFSEGLPTESFHPGDMALGVVGDAARAELLELFPELADMPASDARLSHRALRAFEVRALTAI